MEEHRVIGHVVAVHGFRLKVELSPEARSSSRATLDGVQRAVAINSFLTFDLGAGTHALGSLTDLEARETYDPSRDEELSLELTKPRRIASIQLLGTVKQSAKGKWTFDPGITVLPTLDTPAEVANPDILLSVFGQPPQRNQPKDWFDFLDDPFDFPLELGHQTGDENTKVKASFNDLFSRPLAIVGNTGSGKSYTVASLFRAVLGSEEIQKQEGHDPHVFILDINGEYANAFLDAETRKYKREPNKAYVNGHDFAVPAWLMNSEEVCEWLSAAEQTQQPVLKAWWAQLKAPGAAAGGTVRLDYLDEAQARIRELQASSPLKKNALRDNFLGIADCLDGTGIDFDDLSTAAASCIVADRSEPGGYKNFYGDTVTNPKAVGDALDALAAAIEKKIGERPPEEFYVGSGDTPTYVASTKLADTSNLVTAASKEDAPKIDQHLTTLRMRLKARLADKRWSIFNNFDALGIKSTADWFDSLGFGQNERVTVIDLSMIAHEALPYVCAIIGRVLLEAREKLPATKRYTNPWVLVLEEAHNYARPTRQTEDRGQALSRGAFERVAKEGRKFGMSLVVASQRPSEVSATIISQCANFFSHRLQNPDDIDHFRRIIPKQAQRLLDQVTVLTAGEAIAFGSAMHIPARVQIKTPSQEPWSTTAAPYAEWKKEQRFPVSEILQAWGVEPSGGDTHPEPPQDEKGDSDGGEDIPV